MAVSMLRNILLFLWISHPALGQSGTSQFNTTEVVFQESPGTGLYGYDLSVSQTGGTVSLIVGSPPSVPQKGRGDIQKCNFPLNASTFELSCSSILSLESPAPEDNFGQSLSVNPSTGDVLMCSTVSAEVCGTSFNALPGYCYVARGDSMEPWKYLDPQSTRGCPKSNTVEVMFVLDGSGSINSAEFTAVKKWAVRVTDKLQVDEKIARVAVMQFSSKSSIDMEIDFDDYDNLASLQTAIKSIRQNRGDTNTASALDKAVGEFQKSRGYASKTNKQVMIILTDGKSTEAKQKVLERSNALRNLGVVTYSVGVGSGADSTELRYLATGDASSTERVYEVDNFANLDNIVNSLQEEIQKFLPNEGAGSLKMEFSQAGSDVAISKNISISVRGGVRKLGTR